jgi:hypothetical protein
MNTIEARNETHQSLGGSPARAREICDRGVEGGDCCRHVGEAGLDLGDTSWCRARKREQREEGGGDVDHCVADFILTRAGGVH